MTRPPDFDPYELLGVDSSADAATIDRAYKTRVRYVHPDIAGEAGLAETKRLNLAREWLLDPDLRAQLPPPKRSWRATWARWRSEQAAGAGPHASGANPFGPGAGPFGPGAGPFGPGAGPFGPGAGPFGPAAGSRWRPGPGSAEPPPSSRSSDTSWYWDGAPHPPPRPAWQYDPELDDPLTFDFGPKAREVEAFFASVRSLSSDERARITYSLGDEPPVLFDQFEELLGEELWARSSALDDAVAIIWSERVDESRPLLFPRGRVFGHGPVVANAMAQWVLLGDTLRQRVRDPLSIASLEARCVGPWAASVGHDRYGGAQQQVVAFLDDARTLPLPAAERLARSWQRHMGGFLYGRPGEDWFPGAPERPNPELVSARLAAVDASRIDPPEGLPYERHTAFRCGLRLTAYMLALGHGSEPGRDWLRPWRDAIDAHPSFIDRARWGMPTD